MFFNDLQEYADANPGPMRDALVRGDEEIPLKDVLEAYLGWNGIHGYTVKIFTIVEAADWR